MGDIMDEIRAEARRRGEAREEQQSQMGSLAQMKHLTKRPQLSSRLSNASMAPDRAALDEQMPLLEEHGISIAVCGDSEANPCTQLFAIGGLRLPSDSSFDIFFRDWFKREHFPILSQRLQHEQNQRANSQGLLSDLASTVKSWAMANTDSRLQADVWYQYISQRESPRFVNYCCFRIASVNLGSFSRPCWVSFWGLPDVNDHWRKPPWGGVEVDYASLVDELENRGGIGALTAAAGA